MTPEDAEKSAAPAVARPTPPAWDAQPKRAPPTSLTASWALSRTPPSHKPVTTLRVRTITAKDPTLLTECNGSMTIADVKRAFRIATHLSSRKQITLRWYGAALEDESASLDSLHLPDGAVLEAVFRTRKPDELKAFETIRHVLMVDFSGIGTCLQDGVSHSTLVGAIKLQLKLPPTALIFFTPFFTSSWGTPLEDERTLGSYSVLDGDVLYFTTGEPPPPPADAAPPKKK